MKLRLDIRILAVMLFVWGIANFTSGFVDQNVTHLFIGSWITIISGYLYVSGNNVAITYYRNNGDS